MKKKIETKIVENRNAVRHEHPQSVCKSHPEFQEHNFDKNKRSDTKREL